MAREQKNDGDGAIKNIRRESQAVILELQGDIDLHRSVGVRGALLEVLHEKPSRVVVNMTAVDFMDSSGLATLVEALQVSRRQKTKLALVGLGARVRSIFEISRLDNIFTICETESEALS
ncbi:MAG: STAS domain-containing protein [Sedimentisphaerales bacterium]|nr:STAS domain-containing protein [Sedimentisphaerales bacterium]